MTGAAPARSAAYTALRAVNSGRADLPEAIARARARLSDERDRALAAEITAGTLRWMGALDRVLAAFTGRAVGVLDPEVLDILRLGAYQLIHLERVPAPAVVHDAVEMTRACRKGSASGLVNAVLRRVDREREHLPLPPRPADPDRDPEAALDYLSVTLSHPRWLVARWLARHGFRAAEAWAQFDNTPAPLTLLPHLLRTTRQALAARLALEGVETEPTRLAPSGLVVTRGQALRTRAWAEGLFQVQDEASQLVAAFAAARPGEHVLDACAAPGGKTLAMAGEMRGEGLIVATDLRSRRLALLARMVEGSGVTRVHLARSDASAPLPFQPVFDCVLLDAPCSGLATIRRDPEIRWRRGPDDLAALAGRQQKMLERAAEVVRGGGRLVYATCSSEPEENEDLVAQFLRTHHEFALVDARSTEVARGPAGQVASAAGHVRPWPYAHGLEAFFAAILRRRESAVGL